MNKDLSSRVLQAQANSLYQQSTSIRLTNKTSRRIVCLGHKNGKSAGSLRSLVIVYKQFQVSSLLIKAIS